MRTLAVEYAFCNGTSVDENWGEVESDAGDEVAAGAHTVKKFEGAVKMREISKFTDIVLLSS